MVELTSMRKRHKLRSLAEFLQVFKIVKLF